MNLFLVSSLGMDYKIDGKRIPKVIDNSNGIIEQIKESLNKTEKIALLPGNSYDYERNDSISKTLLESLKMSGITFNEIEVIDDRFNKNIKDTILNSDLIFLSGGYPLEQIAFFDKIELKEILKEYKGTIIGQSAGAMNAADIVACSPEGIENLNDPTIWNGLGLTSISIEPHFILDDSNFNEEERIIRNELLKLSTKKELVALPNGSHIKIINNEEPIIYGEYYIIKDGIVHKPKVR